MTAYPIIARFLELDAVRSPGDLHVIRPDRGDAAVFSVLTDSQVEGEPGSFADFYNFPDAQDETNAEWTAHCSKLAPELRVLVERCEALEAQEKLAKDHWLKFSKPAADVGDWLMYRAGFDEGSAELTQSRAEALALRAALTKFCDDQDFMPDYVAEALRPQAAGEKEGGNG